MWLKIKNPPKAELKNRRKIKKVVHVARTTGCPILIKFGGIQIVKLQKKATKTMNLPSKKYFVKLANMV